MQEKNHLNQHSSLKLALCSVEGVIYCLEGVISCAKQAREKLIQAIQSLSTQNETAASKYIEIPSKDVIYLSGESIKTEHPLSQDHAKTVKGLLKTWGYIE